MRYYLVIMLKRRMLGRKTNPETGTHTLREPAQSKRMSRFHKSYFIWKFTGKMPGPGLSPERRHTLRVSLRSRNACQDFTRAISYGNLEENAAAQNPGVHFYARRRSRNLCQDFTRATFMQKFTGKMPRPRLSRNADTHFPQACAVETHVKISQEPLYKETYRKNAAAQSEHPDQAPAFTLTVRTP